MPGGYHDRDSRHGSFPPKNRNGKSYRPILPSTASPRTPTPAVKVSNRPSDKGTLAPSLFQSKSTAVRAIPAKISDPRDAQKIPVALDRQSPFTTPSKPVKLEPRANSDPNHDKMSRKLDSVASLNDLLAKEKQSQESASQSRKPVRGVLSKTKQEAFDPRAPDSESDASSASSSDDDSDDDTSSAPNFLNKINGQASSKPASTPLKKAKRGKDDEVADSDVEREASAAKVPSTKKAPVRPESSSEEESGPESSDSESEAEEPKKAQASKASTSSSSASEDESEDESGSEAETKKPAGKAAEKAAPVPMDISSDDQSGSESEDEESEVEESAKKPAAKPAVNGKTKAKPTKPVAPPSEASEGSAGEEGAESQGSEASDASDDEAATVAPKHKGKGLDVAGFVGAGKDFVLRQAQGDEDGKDMADFFAKAKLDGKQIWCFTAPASIPISVIEKLEIPMDKAQNGDVILKHNAEDYTVALDAGASTSIELVIPNKKGTRYDTAPQKVENVLHFKRVTQLTGASERPAAGPDAPRPQPSGMKARFRPIGVPNDTPMGKIGFDASDSEDDVEMASAPPAKKTKRVSLSQDSMDIDEPTPKSAKKSKKAREPKAVEPSQASVIEVPNSQPLPTRAKKTKKRRDSIESISSVGSNPKPQNKSTTVTPDAKKASKRKHSEDDQAAQQAKDIASAEKKAKKLKRDDSTEGSARKVTAIPPPTIPSANYSFSSLPASSPAAATPQTKTKSSKKTKETPVPTPSIRRESAVPLPQSSLKQSASAETPKKEKRRRRKSEAKETPVAASQD
ncbi:hypothetical protein Cob_v011388 [Colletotrichum orbiculare MAFF 240422]|uniref:Uncharacterized protein n=1 Tax=Colletotrichum orbiculare (strain 104-T / ATCC 96160 / CBS 514.97 / LARS 414 / MAFF 240422) TaxID=1213857 RepID=N4V2V9_COLOR|nr:hypothetical protein Cob_v011388 [Colletotrichum orbiculare MAFF 240422]